MSNITLRILSVKGGGDDIYIMLIFDLVDNNVPVLDNLTLAEFLTYYGQFDPTFR